MKLLMKQRVFSWTDTYDVYDEAGNKKYFVKAELCFGWGTRSMYLMFPEMKSV